MWRLENKKYHRERKNSISMLIWDFKIYEVISHWCRVKHEQIKKAIYIGAHV